MPAFLLLAFLLVACHDGASNRDPAATYSLPQLQKDFRQLRKLIDRKHPHYFTDRAALGNAFDRQYALLRDGMTSTEFFRVIAPAVSEVRCGHTRLSLPRSVNDLHREHGNYLPFDIHAHENGAIFVVRSYLDEDPLPPGSTIISINGEPAGQILTRVEDCLPADGMNETFKYFTMNLDFKSIYHDCLDSRGSFTIVARTPGNGNETTRVVPAKSQDAIQAFKIAHQIVDPHPPLITTSFSEQPGFAVLKIRFFDFDDDLNAFAERIRRFFQQISDSGTEALILDLRGNDGGGPYAAAHLLGYLIGRPFRYYSRQSTFLFGDLKKAQPVPDHAFSGDLFVLIDGGTYSTTGHFISLLKGHGVGTFIGEESGGSYACNGGYREHRLRNTGIELLLPHATFITNVRGLPQGRGIIPDHPVKPHFADLMTGIDPAMETAIDLIRHGHP